MRAVGLTLLAGLIVGGCTGPTELSNADVEAKKKELSKEAYEEALKKQGKTDQLEQMRAADAEQGERGH